MFGIWQFVRFDVATARFTVFEVLPKDAGELHAAERAANGAWWVGTTEGLLRFEPAADAGRQFSNVAASGGLPFGSIKSLLADPADSTVLWIGFNGQGLGRFDLSTGRLI